MQGWMNVRESYSRALEQGTLPLECYWWPRKTLAQPSSPQLSIMVSYLSAPQEM